MADGNKRHVKVSRGSRCRKEKQTQRVAACSQQSQSEAMDIAAMSKAISPGQKVKGHCEIQLRPGAHRVPFLLCFYAVYMLDVVFALLEDLAAAVAMRCTIYSKIEMVHVCT